MDVLRGPPDPLPVSPRHQLPRPRPPGGYEYEATRSRGRHRIGLASFFDFNSNAEWQAHAGLAHAGWNGGTSTQACFAWLSSSDCRMVSWLRPSTNCGYSGSAAGSSID